MKKAYRNGWMLLLAVTVFVVVFFLFILQTNEPPRPRA